MSIKKIFIRNLLLTICVSMANASAWAQASSAEAAKTSLTLPADANVQKVNEFLATLKPPTSLQNLGVGNNLKLMTDEFEEGGPVRVNMVSKLPRTDAMWLLTMSSQPDGGGVLFGSVMLEPASKPDVSLVVNVYKTQHILLIARAGGKYYGVHRHIKVGTTAVRGPAK